MAEALRGREGITVIVVEDRVICEGVPLSSGVGLSDGLFARLRTLGIEWVRFSAGVDAAALDAMIERIERAERSPDAWKSDLVRVGFIRGVGERAAPGSGHVDPALAGADRLVSLGRLWNDVGSGRTTDGSVLDAVVADISAAATPDAGTIVRLAALKSHDEYTFVHTINVSILGTALARALGMTPDQVHAVTVAALLHDIGKSALPTALLNKSSALTPEDLATLRTHPLEGALMLMNAPDLPDAAAVVAYEHHVRVDGGGYPAVPAGWRTSPATRVVQVADVFDALRTNRPYRPAMPLPEVVAMLRRDAGKALDPDLVDVFLTRVAMRADRERADVAPPRAAA
jgi:putative nucleotidyltransferase with HDIG domain